MDSPTQGSVTRWLEGLRAGESVAAQELWNHYFSRLAAVADGRLRILSAEASGQDVALSAMKSVMLGVQENRFPQITDRTELWPLLVTITARKSMSAMRRQLAAKRCVNAKDRQSDFEAFLGQAPSPEFAAELADELESLVAQFNDPMLRTIAEKRLAGFTIEEIAIAVGRSTRTIIRKLNRIRQEWEERELEDPDTTVGTES